MWPAVADGDGGIGGGGLMAIAALFDAVKVGTLFEHIPIRLVFGDGKLVV
jgi:hypothetical protein